MSSQWYEIHMYINPNTEGSLDFQGIFSVDPNTNIITSFYERTDDTSPTSPIRPGNILVNMSDGYPSEYLYNPTLGVFDRYGCVINYMTALGGAGTFQLSGPLQISGSLANTDCRITLSLFGSPVVYIVHYSTYLTTIPTGISDPGLVSPTVMSPYQIISMSPSGFTSISNASLTSITTTQFSYLAKPQIDAILPSRANNLNYNQIMALQRPVKYEIWYNIIIYNDLTAPIFNGYIAVNSDTNVITNMFSATNINMNLLTYESFSDYKYQLFDATKTRNFSTLGTAFVSSILTNTLKSNAVSWKLIGNKDAVTLYYGYRQQTDIDNNGAPVFSTLWAEYSSYSIKSINVPYSPLNPPCFGEDTKILGKIGDEEQYIPITDVRRGTLIKTLKHGFVPVDMIGKSTIDNLGTDDRIKSRLYKLTQEKYPELLEDLILTGCHSVLVDKLTDEQRSKTIEIMEHVYATDDKYRLMTCLDDRSEPLIDEREFPIYHIALENEDYYANYGVYANGLLVETCSKRYLKEFSKMTLL